MKIIVLLLLSVSCFGKEITNEFLSFNYDDSVWKLVKSYADREDYVFCLEESGKVYGNLQVTVGPQTIEGLRENLLKPQDMFFEKLSVSEGACGKFRTLLIEGETRGQKLFVESKVYLYACKDYGVILSVGARKIFDDQHREKIAKFLDGLTIK